MEEISTEEAMDLNADLRSEVEDLKAAVRHLAGAVKILTEKDDRAQEFIIKVDELLEQSREASRKEDLRHEANGN